MVESNITFTPNLHLSKLPANYHVWAQIMNNNLTVLDGAVSGFIIYDNWRGAWTNSTHYAVGDTVVDLDTAAVWAAQVDHTSAQIPTTFVQDQAAHPTYWRLANAAASARGAWTGPGTSYNVNDFVLANGVKYAMCLVQHVSGPDFDADAILGYWAILFDISNSGGSASIGAAPPLAPAPNQLWWSTDLGQLFIYYNDGNSAQWVPASPTSTVETSDVTFFGAVGDGVADDTLALTAAVSSGAMLFWPAGTYLTTASIPNLHTVRHRGPGIIKRGTDLFAVEPSDSNVNVLYTAVASLGTNDGLSSTQPMSSLQDACTAFLNYGPTLAGKWKIKLAAGTYSTASNSACNLYLGLRSRKLIEIEGPDVGGHPNVPTAILDGATHTTTGFRAGWYSLVKIKDVKFQNYENGGSQSAVVSLGGVMATDNVHFSNCDLGINATRTALYVSGGLFNLASPNDSCIRSNTHTFHSIGYSYDEVTGNQTKAATLAQAPLFTGDGTGNGIYVIEASTGHCFATFDNFSIAANVDHYFARVHFDAGCDFRRSTSVAVASMGSIQLDSPVWNIGTGNANAQTVRLRESGSITAEAANRWRKLTRDTTTFTTTAVTTEQTAYTYDLVAGLYSSIPFSTYLGKALRIRTVGTMTGVAGTKTFRYRLGGTLLVSSVTSADAANSWECEAVIYFTGNATQKCILRLTTSAGTLNAKVSYATSAVNTNSASALTLTATVQVANAADSIVAQVFEVEVEG